MKYLYNEDLSKYTTIHIGGKAQEVIIPETVEELCDIIRERSPEYFIGGGSNLLIADRQFDLIIDLRRFDNSLTFLGDGKFIVGASLRLQSLINQINEKGYGGIEYLYSVPGLVGGAVAMNAGRGRKYNKSISDYIISVDVIRNGKLITLAREECKFEYRKSAFKGKNEIITSCLFEFPGMNPKESSKRKKERLAWCKETQDSARPNFGSVFCEYNPRIMRLARKYKIGRQVHFSDKTLNWIVNEGGNYKEAVNAIKSVELIHRLSFQKCRKEIIIWK